MFSTGFCHHRSFSTHGENGHLGTGSQTSILFSSWASANGLSGQRITGLYSVSIVVVCVLMAEHQGEKKSYFSGTSDAHGEVFQFRSSGRLTLPRQLCIQGFPEAFLNLGLHNWVISPLCPRIRANELGSLILILPSSTHLISRHHPRVNLWKMLLITAWR